MRRFGHLLMLLGLAVGSIVAVAMMLGVTVSGVPLLAAIGLGKLTLVTSGALMAGGAFVHRLAVRRDAAASIAALPAGPGADGRTARLP